MERKNILNILFWITLAVVAVLILLRIFGNGPNDLSIVTGFGLMILFKMWAISDNLNEFKQEVKMSFAKVKSDFGSVKLESSGLKSDMNELNKSKAGKR